MAVAYLFHLSDTKQIWLQNISIRAMFRFNIQSLQVTNQSLLAPYTRYDVVSFRYICMIWNWK